MNSEIYKKLRARDFSYGTVSALMSELGSGGVPALLVTMRQTGAKDVFSDSHFIVSVMVEIGALRSFAEQAEDQSCVDYQGQAGHYTRRIAALIYLWFELNDSLPDLLDFTSEEDLFANITPAEASIQMSRLLAQVSKNKGKIRSLLASTFLIAMMNMTDNVAIGKTLCAEDRTLLMTMLEGFR